MDPKIEYYENGNKKSEQYFNGLNNYYNNNGPAIIFYYENGNKYSETYLINNKWHNTKGPARIYYYETGKISSKSYYLNNEKVHVNSDEEFQKYIKRLNIS